MTNPILYIRNKLCFWITGLNHSEIEEIVEKFNEIPDDYISTSDFNPDDYPLDTLNDYDFSEFITSDSLPDLLVDNEYVSQSDLDTAIEDTIADYVSKEYLNEELDKLKKRIEALEPKKINLKKKPKEKLQ